jgi:hypothetical protein
MIPRGLSVCVSFGKGRKGGFDFDVSVLCFSPCEDVNVRMYIHHNNDVTHATDVKSHCLDNVTGILVDMSRVADSRMS